MDPGCLLSLPQSTGTISGQTEQSSFLRQKPGSLLSPQTSQVPLFWSEKFVFPVNPGAPAFLGGRASSLFLPASTLQLQVVLVGLPVPRRPSCGYRDKHVVQTWPITVLQPLAKLTCPTGGSVSSEGPKFLVISDAFFRR